MSQDPYYHPEIRQLVADALRLDGDLLQALEKALSEELTRRDTIRKGLDSGEKLQFDTIIDMIRERTGVGDADALAMVRAHVPETQPLRGRAERKHVMP